MPAKRVAVLGVGLIGGSIGLAARRRLGVEVVGYDPDRGDGRRGAAQGRDRRGAGSVERGLRGRRRDLLRGAGRDAAGAGRAALAAAGPEAVVTDVGSTKRGIVAALGDDERFIGGHPLAGAETAGVENARVDLFEGARWYLTPTERSSRDALRPPAADVSGLGARPQAIEPESHDRLMATVSHMPHVLANALAAEAATALTGGERLPEVGPSFRDTTRVAGANPPIWADIYAANADAVADSVESVARRLGEAARAAARAATARRSRPGRPQAGEDRRRLLERQLDAGPLRELRIVVANEPGTIAQLALALGEAGVNIEDMALHPAVDMESGSVSLWVAGEEQARAGRGAGPRARPHASPCSADGG